MHDSSFTTVPKHSRVCLKVMEESCVKVFLVLLSHIVDFVSWGKTSVKILKIEFPEDFVYAFSQSHELLGSVAQWPG